MGLFDLFNFWWVFLLVSRQLLTQICLALSALMLRAVENGKPIEQLFYSLQSLQSQDDGNIAVLEMLTVLPEEVFDNQNADSKISPACRAQYCREVSSTDSFILLLFLLISFWWFHLIGLKFSLAQLLSRTPTVLEFLLQQSEKRFDGGAQLHEPNRKILRCLLSWVWKLFKFC